MKFNFDKEFLRENFKSTVVFIGLFILLILAIKSGGYISQQNISTVVVPEKIEQAKNPYQMAYNKCTHPKMAEYYQNKCIEWELKNNGIK